MSQKVGVIGFFFSVLLSGCSEGYQTLQGQTMGTYYLLRFDADTCQVEEQQLTDRLTAINQAMSTYDPAAEIMTINRGAQGQYEISSDLAFVLDAALELGEISEGAFDVTVGALAELWGFGAQTVEQAPTPEQQAEVADSIGSELVTLDGTLLTKHKDGVRLDLSALAKGFAVDELAEIASRAGCASFMADIGGEIRVRGHNPDGRNWRVGIEAPDPAQIGNSTVVLSVTDTALATSGDYRNFRNFTDQRVHHVFDPRTRRPAQQQVVSATVLHSSAMIADGYATAFMVLDVEESLAVAQQQGLAVYLMFRTDAQGAEVPPQSEVQSVYNSAMQRYLID